MLTLQLDNFHVELKEGSIKNVAAPNKAATVKLYDVDDLDVDEFGDERIKLKFTDGEGNEVEVALFPDQAESVANGIESLAAESPLFD
jgi:hypothetical protein